MFKQNSEYNLPGRKYKNIAWVFKFTCEGMQLYTRKVFMQCWCNKVFKLIIFELIFPNFDGNFASPNI